MGFAVGEGLPTIRELPHGVYGQSSQVHAFGFEALFVSHGHLSSREVHQTNVGQVFGFKVFGCQRIDHRRGHLPQNFRERRLNPSE
jgi:hypothetical protein